MTENMKRFLEKISADKALAEKAGKLEKEGLIAFAAEQGFALSEADFAAPAGEISDDELETVAGGQWCGCAVGGGGVADNDVKVCACVVAGMGLDADDYMRCCCPAAGVGTDF